MPAFRVWRTEVARLMFGIDQPMAARPACRAGRSRSARRAMRWPTASDSAPGPQGDGIFGDLSCAKTSSSPCRRALAGSARSTATNSWKSPAHSSNPRHPRRLAGNAGQAAVGRQPAEAILARWLATDPAFLILDEPTRGIDVSCPCRNRPHDQPLRDGRAGAGRHLLRA